MIYRGPDFLVVVWFGSSRTPSPPSPVCSLDRRHRGRLRKRDKLLRERGGEEGGREVESNDRKKAWSSVLYKSFKTLWCWLREGWGEGGNTVLRQLKWAFSSLLYLFDVLPSTFCLYIYAYISSFKNVYLKIMWRRSFKYIHFIVCVVLWRQKGIKSVYCTWRKSTSSLDQKVRYFF
jgi:hypothetical protein